MTFYVMKPYALEDVFSLMDAVLWDAFRHPAISKDTVYGSDGDILDWGVLSKYCLGELALHGYDSGRYPSRPYPPSKVSGSPVHAYIVDEKVETIRGDFVTKRVWRVYPQDALDSEDTEEGMDDYYLKLSAYFKARRQSIEKSKIRIFKMLLEGTLSAYGVRNNKIRMKYKKMDGFSDLCEADAMSPEFHLNNSSVVVTDDDDFSENTFYAYDGANVSINKDEWIIEQVDWENSCLGGARGFFDIIISSEELLKVLPMKDKVKFPTFLNEGIVYCNYEDITNACLPPKKRGRPPAYDRKALHSLIESNKDDFMNRSQESAAQLLVEIWRRDVGDFMPINTALSFIREMRGMKI